MPQGNRFINPKAPQAKPLDTEANRQRWLALLQLLDEFVTGAKPSRVEIANFPAPPESVKVSNLPDAVKIAGTPTVQIQNPVREVTIKNPVRRIDVGSIEKPSWYQDFDYPGMAEALGELLEQWLGKALLVDLRKYQRPAEAIAVKITNLKELASAMAKLIGKTKVVDTLGGVSGFDPLILDASRRPKTPSIATVTLTAADTEYTYDLPAKTRLFAVHLREGDFDLRLAYESAGTADGGNYQLIPASATKTIDGIALAAATTIYLRCKDAAGKIAEIEVWKSD